MRTIMGLLACIAVWAASGDYKLEKREPVHHVFSGSSTLEMDLVSGTITVVGDGGSTIRVDGEKVMRAATQQDLDLAGREVVLDTNEKDGVAQLYANGPFRNNGRNSEDHGFHERRQYDVAYNLTAHVPQATVLRLRNINGEMKVQDTNGAFDVHGLNG